MKVIDLLNKIANGEEVPEKIQVYSDIFVFDNYNCVYEHEETRTNLLSIYNGNILNYEVRIIEKDKKIRKICIFPGLDDDYYAYEEGNRPNNVEINNKIEELLIDKINEIIDYLEENK